MATDRRVHILGVPVDLLTRSQLVALIESAIVSKRRIVLANQNLHGVYAYWTDESFRQLHRQSVVFVDGMSLVMAGLLTGRPISRCHRNTPLDWILEVLALAGSRQWRIFYLGGRRDVMEKGIAGLAAKVPGIQISGHDGFFHHGPKSPETDRVVESINAFQPHILCVGMGMPLQERWILENMHRLCADVVIPVGALIEYFSGTARTPPRGVGSIGLEWLFRLLADPRRYGFRYLVEPWVLARILLRARQRGDWNPETPVDAPPS